MYIGLEDRMFPNSLGDHYSLPGRLIPKTQQMVLNISLLNSQQYYKVHIKGKLEQSRERSCVLSNISV